jgi:hypothetical protein
MVIAPNWGGQVDFLNESNALLINGKEEKANPNAIYWEAKPSAIWFKPNVDDAADKLKFAYQNFETFNSKIEKNRINIYNAYDWDIVSEKLINLCQE